MKTITVKKDELTARITENRNKHNQIYKEAVEAYRDKVISMLERNIEKMRNSKRPDSVLINLPVPEDHTTDYDAVLDMLKMEVGTEVEIGQQDFRTYVRDEWDWKRRWVSNTASYTMSASEYEDYE